LHELKENPRVPAEIARVTGERCKKLEVSAEEVLASLKKLAFFDVRKCFREDGSLKSIPELDEETAFALAGMHVQKAYEHLGNGLAKGVGVIKRIKFHDRGLNLERLGRYVPGFFKNNKVGVEAKISIADRIAAGRKRVAEAQRTRHLN